MTIEYINSRAKELIDIICSTNWQTQENYDAQRELNMLIVVKRAMNEFIPQPAKGSFVCSNGQHIVN